MESRVLKCAKCGATYDVVPAIGDVHHGGVCPLDGTPLGPPSIAEMRLRPAHVLVADPPWPFDDKLPGAGRGAAKHYPTMTIEQIASMPLPPVHDDAVLILWRVSSMVEEAYRVARAWGFVPKTELVWLKRTKNGLVHFGMGRTLRASHETAIVATRGKYKPTSLSVRTVFETESPLLFDAPTGVHSEKPREFYELVETLDEDGPYTELFGRRLRAGWQVLGNEVGKLPPHAQDGA